jgi:predicted enzyme related to lactoylglutathione lyase
MTLGFKTILNPVTDLAKAKATFGALLDAEPIADAPYYVGCAVAGQQIGLVPNGTSQGLTGPTPYFTVDDIQASVQALVAAGGQTVQAPRDVGGGKLVALVQDTDSNVIGLSQDT